MSEAYPQDAPRAGRIVDARGRRVTQLDPVGMHLLRRHTVLDADVLRAIANEPGVRVSSAERVMLVVAVLALLIVSGLFAFWLLFDDPADAPLARSGSLLFFSGMPWFLWTRLRRARFRHVAAAMLAHVRCPHCGYCLVNLSVDPEDGVTVCPECGCGWRLGG